MSFMEPNVSLLKSKCLFPLPLSQCSHLARLSLRRGHLRACIARFWHCPAVTLPLHEAACEAFFKGPLHTSIQGMQLEASTVGNDHCQGICRRKACLPPIWMTACSRPATMRARPQKMSSMYLQQGALA